METFNDWHTPFWNRPPAIAIQMRIGAAAGTQELWEALEAGYRPEGGASFDQTYDHLEWPSYDGHNYLILTRKDGNEPKPGEAALILKWAQRDFPDDVEGLG